MSRLWFFLPLLLASFAPAQRSEMHLQWSLDLPKRKPAWEHTPRSQKDTLYEPVLQGKLVLVGCEHNGALLALDAATGLEKWRFQTNGPIRHAPSADGERIYLGSDDGHLYCLDHAGKLQWKQRGGPSARCVLGHERLISAWPVATRPVLAQGKVYFVAGCWPVDGIHVHALDASDGKVLWTNAGGQFRPSGKMRIEGETLFVDGHMGNGAFDLRNGELKNVKPMAKPAPPGVVLGERTVSVNAAGQLSCIGPGKVEPKRHTHLPRKSSTDLSRTEQLLAATKVTEGFALVHGLADGAVVEGLLRLSKLQVVAVEPNPKVAETIRKRLDDLGLFDSHRLTFVAGDVELPPYFASLITSETQTPSTVARSLRPFGGVLAQPTEKGLEVSRRAGAPAGSANWDHEFADASNCLASADKLVKAPLGVLWYGGVAADPRFYFDGHLDHQSGDGLNPQPVGAQILDGRMFLQGPGLLAAVDVYTGRVLWESPLPRTYIFGGKGGGLGIHSKNHPHPWKHPEAQKAEVPPTQCSRSSGFNFVTTPEALYVAAATRCIRFDPVTGKRLSEWAVPLEEKGLCWGALRVSGKHLIATVFRPRDLEDAEAGHDGNGGDWAGDRMPQSYLLVLDRHTGKLLWHRKANWGFLNRAVAIGDGKVFCADLLLPTVLQKFKRADRKLPDQGPMLFALDLETGAEKWRFTLDVAIKVLAYSAKRDLLLVPNRHLTEWKDGGWEGGKKKAGGKGEQNGRMRALRGADGKVLWQVSDAPYFDPIIVLGDLLIDRHGYTFDLRTGKRHERQSALTGQNEAWNFKKHGCNHLIACDALVTWRTAVYDLTDHSGVMALSGMDAGCTPTLLPACGVINVPNFGTHHKRHRMTALALVHQPENNLWAQREPAKGGPVVLERVGVNFAAPGDRADPGGLLWVGSPGKGGSAALASVKGEKLTVFQLPPGTFTPTKGGAPAWVLSSGLLGVDEITIATRLGKGKQAQSEQKWTVRLHLAEPEDTKVGERVLDVLVQGKRALVGVDVVQLAGAPRRGIVQEIRGVQARERIVLTLRQTGKRATVLSGVEVVREKSDP